MNSPNVNHVDTSFIGNFKRGDNLKYNAQIVANLYEAEPLSPPNIFNKPIFVFNLAIVEAATFDFIMRVREHTFEFRYLDNKTNLAIRQLKNRNLDKFNNQLLRLCKKHKLFGQDDEFYEFLEQLIYLRNRIHIQNKWGKFEADDARAFSRHRVKLSEQVAEYILKYLSVKYPRKIDCVDGIVLSWKPHFDIDFIKEHRTFPVSQI